MRTTLVILLLVSAEAAAAEDPDTGVARRRYEVGAAAYEANDYQRALGEFEAARRVKALPALEYNIARCLDRLERYSEAVAAYERYLATSPQDAAEIRERVRVLTERLSSPSPTTTASESGPQAAVAPNSSTGAPQHLARRRRYTWIVGGAGVAILAGSLVAGLVANARYGTLKSECAADGGCSVATAPDAQGVIDGGRVAGLASDVLLGIGAAAVVAGVVLFFVEGRHATEPHAWRILPTVGVHGGGLAFEVSP